jgi:hypothetical protein
MGYVKGLDGIARTMLNPLEGSIGDVDLDEITANTVSAVGNISAGNLSVSGNIQSANIIPVTPSVTTSNFTIFTASDVGVSYNQNPGTDGYFSGVAINKQEANIYNARISAVFVGMNYTANGNPAGNVTVSSITTSGGSPVGGNLTAETYRFYVTDGGNLSPSTTSLIVNYTTPRLPESSSQANALFVKIPTYTASNLVMITGSTGQLASVSDSPTSGGKVAYWDTTNLVWKYVADDSPV